MAFTRAHGHVYAFTRTVRIRAYTYTLRMRVYSPRFRAMVEGVGGRFVSLTHWALAGVQCAECVVSKACSLSCPSPLAQTVGTGPRPAVQKYDLPPLGPSGWFSLPTGRGRYGTPREVFLPPPPRPYALMPDCGVHYLWFAFVCFFN